MTDDRPNPRHAGWIAILTAGLLLQACSPAPVPTVPSARVYAADVTGGAKVCEVQKVKLADGQTTNTTIKVGNDGGWCGLPVRQSGGKAFDVGLLSARPAHGSVMIHEVGDETRIDYTPDRGFTGSDSFAVSLVPGGAVIHIEVTVTPPGPAAKG